MSVEEAKRIIEKIALSKGVWSDEFVARVQNSGDPDKVALLKSNEEIREDLGPSLEELSDDLYSSKAHFLMECIQNADDNEYPEGCDPFLKISIQPEEVRIECNEKGFTEANIYSLCRVGRGTKSKEISDTSSTKRRAFIGEKGIGFKSVFKIACRVNIASHPFFFQLDKRRKLGMIVPVWDRDFFRHQILHNCLPQTTIVLTSPVTEDEGFDETLEGDVEYLSPTLLLFLNKLQKLEISIGRLEKSLSCSFSVSWEGDQLVTLIEECVKSDGASRLNHWTYYTFTFEFSGLPPEERRANATATSVTLAFPVVQEDEFWVPEISDQSVFAYLPLGKFGLKYIINADFLTTSNRQGVDETCRWNKALANCVVDAFCRSVKIFNANNDGEQDLRYTWPLFLEANTSSLSSFWKSIPNNLHSELKESEILVSQLNTYRKPRQLKFMGWAQDRHSQPLLGSFDDFISSSYPDQVVPTLVQLGVGKPDLRWLTSELRQLHLNGRLYDADHDHLWHEDLARAVLNAVGEFQRREIAQALKDIPLIPIQDGSWRCQSGSDSDAIFFPTIQEVSVPENIELTLVLPEAASSPSRSKLFEILGVKSCGAKDIVDQILLFHHTFEFAPVESLVDHVRCLYDMRDMVDLGYLGDDIWFDTEGVDSYSRGPDIYFAEETPSSSVPPTCQLRSVFEDYTEVKYLSQIYVDEFIDEERETYVDWLNECFGIESIPRLCYNDSLHPDFRWLLDRQRQQQALEVLKTYWTDYEQTITSVAKEEIKQVKFLCEGEDYSEYIELQSAFAPSRELKNVCGRIAGHTNCAFLTLPSNDIDQWEFLTTFGVGFRKSLHFYLWLLQQNGIRDRGSREITKKIYTEIQSRCDGSNSINVVRNVFNDTVILDSDNTWKPQTAFVWDAPANFSRKSPLIQVYGMTLFRLFSSILQIPDVSLVDAINYLKDLATIYPADVQDVISTYEYMQRTVRRNTREFELDTKICQEAFDTHALVAAPFTGGGIRWKRRSQCVWKTSELFQSNNINLQCKTVLHAVLPQADSLEYFFKGVLQLPDAGLKEFLDELHMLQRQNSHDENKVLRIYECIAVLRNMDAELIRSAFNRYPLIYARHRRLEQLWHFPNDCVWSESCLRSKVALRRIYNNLSSLFLDTIRVPDVTLDVLVTELIETSNASATAETFKYAKELIDACPRFLAQGSLQDRLASQSCWPCLDRGGTKVWRATNGFYANDRQDLHDIFSGHVSFLDMRFEEVRKTRSFLTIAGVKFISNSYHSETRPEQPFTPDELLTEVMRTRAPYLYQCICYFDNDSNPTRPYMSDIILENAEVIRVSSITTIYSMQMPGPPIEIENNDGTCHVLVESDSLKVYVRVGEDASLAWQSWNVELPNQLAKLWKIEPQSSPLIFSVLNIPFNSLGPLLVQHGIISGQDAEDWREERVDEDDEGQGADLTTGTWPRNPTNPRNETFSRTDRDEDVISFGHQYETSRDPAGANTQTTPSWSARQSHTSNATLRTDALPVRAFTRRGRSSQYTRQNATSLRQRIQELARGARIQDTIVIVAGADQQEAGSSSTQRQTQHTPSNREFQNFNMTEMRSTLPGVFRRHPEIRSSSSREGFFVAREARMEQNDDRSEENNLIGYLGEQFIITLLKERLQLPSFSEEENWTSRLRNYEGEHSVFIGSEISDVMYPDSQGTFTEFLRRYYEQTENGVTPSWLENFPDEGPWPTYHIEVKSTTSADHRTPFYVSGSQYETMRLYRISGDESPRHVYIIVRVSGIDTNNVNVPQWRLYLDPFTIKQQSGLHFRALNYMVTPSV